MEKNESDGKDGSEREIKLKGRKWRKDESEKDGKDKKKGKGQNRGKTRVRGQSNDIMDMVWKKFRETTRRKKKKERREKHKMEMR